MPRAAIEQGAGAERRVEAQDVDLLHLAEQLLAAVVRGGELGIPGEDEFRAAMELEVDRAAAQVLVQLLDLELAFLPPGGDGREIAVHAQRSDRAGERRLEALGTQESKRPQRARTFTVWPTKSSIRRSSS